jgi:hypothetical protein
MERNSLSARYEADASKVETRWAYGGSALRIQIHFWTQRIMRCMGESVEWWSSWEDSYVSHPRRYKSWEDCSSSRRYTSSEDTYRPSVRRYRSSEDVTTSWED